MSAPRAFRRPALFRAWLSRNHSKATELAVRCFKAGASEQGMTYRQALDEALCYGWIDGVRHRIDDVSFRVRFTPRKPKSIWSQVNLARVEELIAEGRMAAPGLAAFRSRDQARTGLYSFERETMTLAPAFAREFREHKKAWSYFQTQPPWYRRTSVFWVMSAKREETRARRLRSLIACSAEGKRIGPLARE